MKKFDLRGVKGVFANLRGNEKSATKGDVDVQESLQPHDFFCGKLTRHGFPYHPTCMAWDPIQKLLAIGTKHGVVRLMGKPGVDVAMQHESDAIVLHLTFLINEGALITVCSDDFVNLWSYRQKVPEVVHSLKFCRERITCLHLPFQSKWLYLGTERGNVHIVNVETFTVCGYTINWNKAIEISRKTHPGPVVHLSDNPMDRNKLLIGFETGLVVCWDLRCKMAEFRFNSNESLRDACWHQEGKLFMCSYADGTLSTWNFKQQAKPVSVMTPHSKASKNGQLSPCKPINRLEWRTMRSGEPYVIFSGGMSYDGSKLPCLTIMHGKDVTVLEMEHKILDFVVLSKNLWTYEYDDPYAIIVLLSSDLIFVDMTIPGYPCFQCPYALDIHESPVTCLRYISDCASDLIPAIYSCGTKQTRKGYSKNEFPVSGGECSSTSCSYTEMLITGHADGSVKFWDVSGTSVQFLYRMKTSKQFEKVKRRDTEDEDVLAIQHIYLDEESRLLTLAAAHHIILYNYSRKETTSETPVVEVSAISEIFEEASDSPTSPTKGYHNSANYTATTDNLNTSKPGLDPIREVKSAVKVRAGAKKHAIGYQPQLITLLQWCDGASAPIVTCICVNSSYGMMAVGTTNSMFIIDTVQKTCLLNILPADLCNSEVGRLTTPGSRRLQSVSSTEQEGVRSPDYTDSNSKLHEQSSPECDDKDEVYSLQPPPSPGNGSAGSPAVSPDTAANPLGRTRSTSSQSLPATSLAVNNNYHKTLSKTLSDDDQPLISDGGVHTERLHPPKASWTRRLSAKVGLSATRQKLGTHGKSLSAVASSPYAHGFFIDQKTSRKYKSDKPDGVLSRSRSPSTSSLDATISTDVRFLMFADSYSRKQSEGKSLWSKVAKAALAKSKSQETLEVGQGDLKLKSSLNKRIETMSSLWIGTNLGALMALDVIPYYSERATKPILVAHSGTTFQLKGAILELCFLNCRGVLVPVEAEIWGEGKEAGDKRGKRLVSRVSRLSASSTEALDKVSTGEQQQHIAVICSDNEVRALSLPSQSVLYKERFPDGVFMVKAQSVIFKDSACLACLGSNGNLMMYSLPSLRQLLNVNYFNDFDFRALKTLDFSNHGHAMYMCTANEIQKITVSADMCRTQPEMQCEPFVARENPEPPKQNFLKSLFGSGPSVFDREELFGTAGKASHGLATMVPGAALRAAHAGTTGIAADMARTRIALDERGEKLGRLDDRSEAMKERAREFSNNAAMIADRYKNLKWYQF